MSNTPRIVVEPKNGTHNLKMGECFLDRENNVMYVGFTEPIDHTCVGSISANLKMQVRPITKYKTTITVSPKYANVTLINSLGENRKLYFSVKAKAFSVNSNLKIKADKPRKIGVITNAKGYTFKANLTVKGGI